MDRRNFLKLGFWSSATLATVGATATLTGCSENKPANENLSALRTDDVIFLSALIPVITKGAFPTGKEKQEKVDWLISKLDSSIYLAGPDNTKQILQLFDLLNMRITRFLTTGVWYSWDQADEKSIEDFLSSWKNSSVELLNVGYRAISLLIIMNWYGHEDNFHLTGYPGAPKLF